jgi:hypothetical protein
MIHKAKFPMSYSYESSTDNKHAGEGEKLVQKTGDSPFIFSKVLRKFWNFQKLISYFGFYDPPEVNPI